MADKEVQEGNRLIAEFMGFRFLDGWIYATEPEKAKLKREAKYHTSWDWLMPVVEKIEAIENSDDYEVDIFGNCCEIGYSHSAVGKTKIEAVWKAVVQFINYYNQTQKR